MDYDRLVIPVALGGCLIRIGNLFNSEIVGKPSDLPWAFCFKRNYEFSQVPRHPAQLYEAISCLVLFIIFFFLLEKYRYKLRDGILTSWFLIVLFAFRFLYEFIKENQEPFEQNLLLNMGQLLSISFILSGFILMIWIKIKSSKSLI